MFWTRQVFVNAAPAVRGVLSGMFTSLTNEARLVQSTAFSGTNGVRVRVGEGVFVISVSPVTGISAWVAVTGASVAGGAVVAGRAVAISVTCVACPPQADKMIPASKMIESAFLDILVSFVQTH
jgi:hypothetical protein